MIELATNSVSTKQNFVATELVTNSVAIKPDFFAIELATNSVVTKPDFIAIELKTKRWAFFFKPENCCFGLFSSLFHPRTINTRFLGFQGKWGGGRTPLMGFLSLNCPFS